MCAVVCLALLSFVAAGFLQSCNHNEITAPTQPAEEGNVTTTIAGQVVDESGSPVTGAAVMAHGMSTTTDDHGVFFFSNITVPASRCFVIVKQNGYFTAAKAEHPNKASMTQMKVMLAQDQVVSTVSAAAGGTVSLPGNATVQLQGGSFVTASGAPYTGQVQVSAKHLDPSAANFYELFQGDFEGTRSDASRTLLKSFGVLMVELHDAAGAQLQLTASKPATLTYPIPASMQASAPSVMPLWHFDEQLGMWKEEGTATKVGNTYVGTVQHFSSWNCDYPGDRGTVTGHLSCSGINLEGVIVHVGQRLVFTDRNGQFTCFAPAGETFKVQVIADENAQAMESDPVTTSVSKDQTTDLGDLTMTTCPAFVKGQLIDCDSKPIGGLAMVAFQTHISIIDALDGHYTGLVPAAKPLLLSGVSFTRAISTPQLISPLANGQIFQANDLVTCTTNIPDYLEVPLGQLGNQRDSTYIDSIAISRDGSMLAIPSFVGGAGSIGIMDTKTATVQRWLSFGIAGPYDMIEQMQFSKDNSKILGKTYMGMLSIWNVATGAQLFSLTTENVTRAYFSPDGNKVIMQFNVGDPNHLGVEVWDIASNTKTAEYTMSNNYDSRILGVRDNGELVTYSGGVFATRDPATGNVTNFMNITGNYWSGSHNNETFYFADAQGKSGIVDVASMTSTMLAVAPSYYYRLDAIADDQETIVACDDKSQANAVLFSISQNKVIKSLPNQLLKVYYRCFDISSDGKTVAALYAGGIRIWHLK